MSDIINKRCTGCSVANKEISLVGGFIYETENFILLQDPEVPIKGFLIIQSKNHLRKLIDFNKKEQMELFELINEARFALDKLDICKAVTIVQEERSKHFHIWLFPNYEWMQEKFGKGIIYLRDINEYVIENATEEDKKEVLEVVQKLKRYFNNKGE